MPFETGGLPVLHLVRRAGDREAMAAACAQQAAGQRVTLLLLQDAVLDRPAFSGAVVACAEDDMARGGRCFYPCLSYEEIVRLLFEHQRVISW